MKKAQIAMESIMIYGLAILVVMLAIGALMYFDVLDLGGLLPDRCEIKGVALTCENYVVTQTGATLEIRNNLGRNIDISEIKIYGEGGTDMEGIWGAADDKCLFTGSTRVTNGEMKDFAIADCTVGINVGKKITGVIKLTYKVIGSQIPIVKFGEIRAPVS